MTWTTLAKMPELDSLPLVKSGIENLNFQIPRRRILAAERSKVIYPYTKYLPARIPDELTEPSESYDRPKVTQPPPKLALTTTEAVIFLSSALTNQLFATATPCISIEPTKPSLSLSLHTFSSPISPSSSLSIWMIVKIQRAFRKYAKKRDQSIINMLLGIYQTFLFSTKNSLMIIEEVQTSFALFLSSLLVSAGVMKFVSPNETAPKKPCQVQIFVLGDLGHSPRMNYHAECFASILNYQVELIGFKEGDAIEAANENIRFRYLENFKFPRSYLIQVLGKILYLSLQIFWLVLMSPCEIVLVQSPPSIPVVFVAFLACKLKKKALIVDVHNLGFTLLKGKKEKSRRVIWEFYVWLYRFVEKRMLKMADACLCVSEAMKSFLISEWGLKNVAVLYDRPGAQFQGKVGKDEKLEICERVKIPVNQKLLVSSTSWTDDEDFSMLLEAVKLLDKRIQEDVLLFITGKGPNKEDFLRNFAAANLTHFLLRTEWLAAEDYPKILGIADVGVSLHLSSSGLDLPMKVVDMLGAELPVVAVDFPALNELLNNGLGLTVNGGSKELADAIEKLLVKDENLRKEFSKNAKIWRKHNFHDEWKHKFLAIKF
jgi:beta-1,4-mannosyltransferase